VNRLGTATGDDLVGPQPSLHHKLRKNCVCISFEAQRFSFSLYRP
jgi:hypothetical protein